VARSVLSELHDWFLNECVLMIQSKAVNYFKWDKATDGAVPHTMALLRLAMNTSPIAAGVPERHAGTWPSPFWLTILTVRGAVALTSATRASERRAKRRITYRDAPNVPRSRGAGPLYR